MPSQSTFSLVLRIFGRRQEINQFTKFLDEVQASASQHGEVVVTHKPYWKDALLEEALLVVSGVDATTPAYREIQDLIGAGWSSLSAQRGEERDEYCEPSMGGHFRRDFLTWAHIELCRESTTRDGGTP
ncbi:MAG TPA: hypothetical protein DFS52_30085 [Myxococcales bacterium]|jgi:hypothetical protein|nr:hypothetical protein [Myxococcales bacterium]